MVCWRRQGICSNSPINSNKIQIQKVLISLVKNTYFNISYESNDYTHDILHYSNFILREWVHQLQWPGAPLGRAVVVVILAGAGQGSVAVGVAGLESTNCVRVPMIWLMDSSIFELEVAFLAVLSDWPPCPCYTVASDARFYRSPRR
jgi:hypothetical protein